MIVDAAATAERSGRRGSLRIQKPNPASVARALKTHIPCDPPGTVMIAGRCIPIADLPPETIEAEIVEARGVEDQPVEEEIEEQPRRPSIHARTC